MLSRNLKYFDFRSFSSSSFRANLEKAKPSPPPPQPAAPSTFTEAVHMTYSPNEFDKKILLWSGKYKTADEIPNRISFETMNSAKSKLRIKLSNALMVIALCSCGYYIWRGKKLASEGETINTMVLRKHQKLDEFKKNVER